MRPISAHTLAARIGCVISLFLLLLAFWLPQRSCKALVEDVLPHAQTAETALKASDWPSVKRAVKSMSDSLHREGPQLRFFFHHQDVDELFTLTEEALQLSDMESDELMSCLIGVKKLVEHLNEIETPSLPNLF